MEQAKRKSRTFNVEFLPVRTLKREKDKLVYKPIDISKKIENIKDVNIKDRFKNVNGSPIRLQEIYKLDTSDLCNYKNISKCNNIWILKFVKFKDDSILGIAGEDGNYDEDKLDELIKSNKGHLASATVCLFDSDKNMFIVGVNREGVTTGELLGFLSKVLKNSKLNFGYISKTNKFDINSIVQYRNLKLGFKNLLYMGIEEKKKLKSKAPSVYMAIKCAENLGVNSLTFDASMGDEKTKGFKDNIGEELLFLAGRSISTLSRLKIGIIVDNKKKKMDTVDFFQDRLTDSFAISFAKDERIKSDKIKERLLQCYDNNYLKCK